ncbi:MAG TPA: XdhC family protein [Candidatus Acidoferrum sp.]|nr:XdhC family protein [Candidatus Acidoferrum sp.]
MRQMLKTLSEYIRSGRPAVLVTVIASSGATPRGAGARMLVGEEGRICGTIGGGAVEYRSTGLAMEALSTGHSHEHNFTLTKDDVQNLGMICGGAVDVFFRYIAAGDKEVVALCEEAQRLFSKGRDMWLLYDISRGGTLGLYTKEEGFFPQGAFDFMPDMLSRHPVRITGVGHDIYSEQISSSGRVYVFGCGHVAQELVPVLAHVGFPCVALDDRPEFADRALFPTAHEVKRIDFARIFDAVEIGPEDYVCVMTRGHAFDAVVQAQVLKTPACYIGVIGSAAKKAGVFQRLYEQGFTTADTDRITSPIGLAIKAETPAEIAISIAGQLIEFRARRNAQ